MNHNIDEMREDYSDIFATQTPVRGKYYEQAMRAKRLVQLDSDVLSLLPTAKDVNAALRGSAMNHTVDTTNDDLLPEYNFDYSKGVRGKYYEQAMRAKRLVQLS